MSLVWTLLVGLLVGALAKLLTPGRDPGGIVVTMLLGVGGSFVALILGRYLGVYGHGEVRPGIIASTVGAMLILFVYRVAKRRVS